MTELQNELREIFEEINSDPHKYPSNWKHNVMDLQAISNSRDNPFTENARGGFNYLGQVVFCTICDKCCDKKAFIWLKSFAKAWLDSTELPIFPTSCFYSEGMDTMEDNE